MTRFGIDTASALVRSLAKGAPGDWKQAQWEPDSEGGVILFVADGPRSVYRRYAHYDAQELARIAEARGRERR